MTAINVDPKEMARLVRRRTGRKLPLDITSLVEKHGIKIVEREVERSVTGVLVIDSTPVTILVNRAFDAKEQRFSLAHLLGHFVLHKKLSPMFVDFLRPTEHKRNDRVRQSLEREADEFAAELLMPEDIIRKYVIEKPCEVGAGSVIHPIAARFGVSELTLALRLSQFGVISPSGSIYSGQF